LYIHKSQLGKGNGINFVDGWYPTGDVVEVIQHDPLEFRFIHRKNDMINVGGYKVNPLEIESIVESNAAVKKAKIYCKPSSILGNILLADVVLSSSISEHELRSFLTKHLQPYKIPRIINFVDEIEQTRSGKTKRS
jgi:acyl-coenzyme A synthetase/AMP-(fatty) acid ligase